MVLSVLNVRQEIYTIWAAADDIKLHHLIKLDCTRNSRLGQTVKMDRVWDEYTKVYSAIKCRGTTAQLFLADPVQRDEDVNPVGDQMKVYLCRWNRHAVVSRRSS